MNILPAVLLTFIVICSAIKTMASFPIAELAFHHNGRIGIVASVIRPQQLPSSYQCFFTEDYPSYSKIHVRSIELAPYRFVVSQFCKAKIIHCDLRQLPFLPITNIRICDITERFTNGQFVIRISPDVQQYKIIIDDDVSLGEDYMLLARQLRYSPGSRFGTYTGSSTVFFNSNTTTCQHTIFNNVYTMHLTLKRTN